MAGDPRPKTPRVKKARKVSKAEFPVEAREQVARRSLGLCEAQETGCWGTATILHHIKRRKEPDNSAGNALHVCLPCHEFIHSHVSISEARGWLVRSGS